MKSETFEHALQACQRRRPFHSFTVELVSGDRFSVDHPEALIARGGVAVFINAKGVPTIFDHDGVSQIIGNGRRRSH
jgi:hypothetical protein